MREVMQCLLDELREAPADNKTYRILQFMVEAKLKDLKKGNCGPQQFSRTALLHSVEPFKAKTLNATTWLPPTALERFLNSRLVSLCERLRRAGLEQMPVVRANDGKGGKGNERTFWLDVAPLPADSVTELPWTHIKYSRSDAGSVRPSLFLRLIFRNGELQNRSWRGCLLLAGILIGTFLLVAWMLTSIWVADHVLIAMIACGSSWVVWSSYFSPWWRLVDDRVIKAPATFLAFGEDSAELEIHRNRNGDDGFQTRFVRFSGDCPICSGQVLLMKGKPDQRLPIVGRCIESPYAHVYSFDPARLIGTYIGSETFPPKDRLEHT